MRTREEKNQAFGFTSNTVQVRIPHESLNVYYIEKGLPDAPVLLLLHGLGGSASNWIFNCPLADRYRIIAPDLPGFGNSSRFQHDEVATLDSVIDVLQKFLDTIGVGKVKATVGSSMGGVMAIHLAKTLDDRSESLTLVGPGGIGRRINPFTLIMRWIPPPIFNPKVWRYIQRWLDQHETKANRLFADPILGLKLLADSFDRPPAHDQEWVKAMRHAVEFGLGYLGQRLELIKLIQGDVKSLRCPILIVWGNRDKVITPKHGHLLKEMLPEAKFVLFTKSGHLPHVEQSEKFNRIFGYFLDFGPENFGAAMEQREDIFAYVV